MYWLRGDENIKQHHSLQPACAQWGPLHDMQLALCYEAFIGQHWSLGVSGVEATETTGCCNTADRLEIKRYAFGLLGDEKTRGISFGCLQLPWGRVPSWRRQALLGGAQGQHWYDKVSWWSIPTVLREPFFPQGYSAQGTPLSLEMSAAWLLR